MIAMPAKGRHPIPSHVSSSLNFASKFIGCVSELLHSPSALMLKIEFLQVRILSKIILLSFLYVVDWINLPSFCSGDVLT